MGVEVPNPNGLTPQLTTTSYLTPFIDDFTAAM
jgi:hypothetical protein